MNTKKAPNECESCGSILESNECEFCQYFNEIMSVPNDAEYCVRVDNRTEDYTFG